MTFTIEYCGEQKVIEVINKMPQSGGTFPPVINFDGVGCKSYTFSASCDWNMASSDSKITVTPSSGNANTLYDIQVCYLGNDVSSGHGGGNAGGGVGGAE